MMILLVTAVGNGREIAERLGKALKRSVDVASSVRKALAMARSQEYVAVVLDDGLAQVERAAVDTLLSETLSAVPVYVNFAICGEERLANEVQLAIRRQEEAKMIAMRAATSNVQHDIRDAVTGILLSTELALKVPSLPKEAEEKMKVVRSLAREMRKKVGEPAGVR